MNLAISQYSWILRGSQMTSFPSANLSYHPHLHLEQVNIPWKIVRFRYIAGMQENSQSNSTPHFWLVKVITLQQCVASFPLRLGWKSRNKVSSEVQATCGVVHYKCLKPP